MGIHAGGAAATAGMVAGTRRTGGRLDAEYVLPIRWDEDADLSGLTAYLTELTDILDVTVVDGSSEEAFARHHDVWAEAVRHVPPAPWPGGNGKVRGVTGVRMARHPLVVVADDDVRYSRDALVCVLDLLQDADLVVPQNVFSRWPWHARWDTGRQLLNRAFGGDYPGTLGVRRSFLADGYDGDVLFENLELMRTVERRGGVVRRADRLFVDRLPPSVAHFWSQRVRQAYDSFGQPRRLAVELALLPVIAHASKRPLLLSGLVVGAVLAAEFGRRRQGGDSHFPATAAWWAPIWATERALCIWIALVLRLRGGVRYGDGRIFRAVSERVRPARRG